MNPRHGEDRSLERGWRRKGGGGRQGVLSRLLNENLSHDSNTEQVVIVHRRPNQRDDNARPSDLCRDARPQSQV